MTQTLIVEPRLIKRQSPSVEQYASLLIRLHEQMRHGSEEEAEKIREQMDAPGLLLTEDEIKLVKGLSADLYMLADEEILRPSGYSQKEFSERLVSAYKARDADTVLTLLRKTERPDSPSSVAHVRHIIYNWLGMEESARIFLLHASELDPQNITYRVNILTELNDEGQLGPIRSLATSVFNNPNASSHAVLMAAGALFFMSKASSTDVARADLGQSWRKLRELFKKIPPVRLPVEDAVLGLLLSGAVLEALGRKSRAREEYEEATKINITTDAPWVVLGISWFKDDAGKAMPYFKRAVELDTEHPLPYLTLAIYALTHGDYLEAKRFSEKLLEKIRESGGPSSSPRLSAQVYELLGLVEDEQNGPTDVAINYLKEAVHLDPENERIQASYIGLLRETETKDLELFNHNERDKRLSDWLDALQHDTPSPTSMLFPNSQRPPSDIWSSWPLAAAA